MTATDPTLSRWERGERRRSMLLGAMTAALLILATVVGVGAASLADLSDVLHRRSPVIARIDAAEHRSECVDRLSSSFLAAVGDLLDARLDSDDDPERDAAVVARLQVTRDAVAIVATDPDVDPCHVPLPAPQ